MCNETCGSGTSGLFTFPVLGGDMVYGIYDMVDIAIDAIVDQNQLTVWVNAMYGLRHQRVQVMLIISQSSGWPLMMRWTLFTQIYLVMGRLFTALQIWDSSLSEIPELLGPVTKLLKTCWLVRFHLNYKQFVSKLITVISVLLIQYTKSTAVTVF